MKFTHLLAAVGLGLVVLATSACTVDIDRNSDGSLSVAARMTAENLQEEIEQSLKDPLIEDLNVALHDNHIMVAGERRRATGNEVDEISFRLDLRADDGVLVAVISDATLNDYPIDGDRVALWNERIARNLTRSAQRRPNSSLTGVQITTGSVVMTWTVETARSRGN